MIYLKLFWEFFQTGLFSIGGGLATLPFLYDMGERTGWFTAGQVADMLAISESTPGPIGVNMATYAGYTTAGIPGGIIATLGLVTPSILVILIIARILKQFRSSPYVDAVFSGLRPASVALIAAAGLSVAGECFLNLQGENFLSLLRWPALLLAAVLLAASNIPRLKKLHPALFILAGAVAGILLRMGGA